MSPVVRTVTKAMLPLVILFGAYIIVHGHLTPGGGFQGGAIIATVMALVVVAFSKTDFNKSMLSSLESSGLLVFISLAFLGISTGFFFNWLAGTDSVVFGQAIGAQAGVLPPPAPFFSSGTIALMSIAVGLEVVAALTIIVVALAVFTFRGREVE